nr:CotH kinase family protein [uncultured Acetatifactor sp.]
MIGSKYATKIACIAMAAAVLLCVLAVAFPQKLAEAAGQGGVAMEYEAALFQTDSVMQIDIRMENDVWEEMLAGAMAEEYYSCDVVINGLVVKNVGIRPKGNTSLSAIAVDPDTDRFSLKLEFDHYVEGQTCLGLDKLVLNNNYADATNMKEAIVYDMYQYLGADASLYNYAEISVNGTYWGVYLALEAVEDSFLLRNYGVESGNLYKPEGMGMGGGGDAGGPGFSDFESGPGDGDGLEQRETGGFPGGQRFSMGSGGADLNYTDDELDSYSVIWDGAVTDSGKKDYRRVVSALRDINEGTNLEECLDIDNVLKYMAVHTFSVNMDSLSGSMAHNYYLYEHDGELNVIPWDYNLSFGGMGMGMGADSGASGMVNDAIDSPFQGTEFFDALLEDEACLARYHGYLQELTEGYVSGGKFQDAYNRIRSQIDGLVEADPTAFYTAAEYGTAAEMLYQTVMLRAESIRGQLDGTIPSTDAGQRADGSALVDASSIDIEAMGVMGGGRDFGFGDGEIDFPGFGQEDNPGDGRLPGEESPLGERDAEAAEGYRQPPGMPGGPGAMPESFDSSDMPEGRGMPREQPRGDEDAGMPQAAGNQPKAFQPANTGLPARNLFACAGWLLLAIIALVAAKHYRRMPGAVDYSPDSDYTEKGN